MTCACESVHEFPCQFPAETEFFPLDGLQWCRFHLPLTDATGNYSAKGRFNDGWERLGAKRQKFDAEIYARLREATQQDDAILRAVVFPPEFVFGGITKTLYVNFANATFGNGANFKGVTFGDGADFIGAIFGFRAIFEGATFSVSAQFDGTTFDESAYFSGATFDDRASFVGATFGDWTIFDGATFGDRADFDGATFGNLAFFRDATFGNSTRFSRVVFQGAADFSVDEKLDTKPDFQHLNFSNAIFTGPCTFANHAFGNSINFNGVVFRDLAEFHGCTFHPGMSFHQTKFLKTKGVDNDATETLERSYRTLKLEMEKLRARNEEADFFALEMECRRQRGSVPWFERFAATAYKHLSDYGRSIVRPLAWLIPLTFFAFLIYRDLGACHAAAFRDGSEILEFTLEQMFSPSKVWFSPSGGEVVHKDLEDLLSQYPPLVKILASLQSLATIGLLTLFLLALRRRFKMD